MNVKIIAEQFAKIADVRVFPTNKDKEPVYSAKWSKTTKDIEHWEDWRWQKATGYGVILDGMVVIDYDHEDEFKDDDDTLVVKTRKGYHAYYKTSEDFGNHTKPDPKRVIDIKAGSRGYVVGPGSDGYTFHKTQDIAELPLHKEMFIKGLLKNRPKKSKNKKKIDPTTLQRRVGSEEPEYYTGFLNALLPHRKEDYETWRNIGMALKVRFGGTDLEERAYDVYDEWSKGSESYDEKNNRKMWEGYKTAEELIEAGTENFYTHKTILALWRKDEVYASFY